MNFGSVCSGIEAASAAWIPLGWNAVFYSDIERFPCEVLKQRHPGVPNFGDMTKFKEWPDATIDLLVGGTPCQSFSVAGLRKGLADPRGNLMLTYLAIADRYRPDWLVWENVPGVLSDKGNAFGAFLGGLGKLGYGFAYRVLDAQYFGVPQRRRRVFVVGHLGDWRRAAAVLFERASLRGDSAPSRKAGERPAPTISARTQGGGGLGTDFDCDGGLIAAPHADISPALKARDGKGPSSDGDGDGDGAILVPMVAHSLRADGFDASEDGTGRGTPLVAIPINADALRGEGTARTPSPDADGRIRLRDPGFGVGADGDPAGTISAAGPGAIAFAQNQRDEVRTMDVAGALASESGMKQQTYIAQDYKNGAYEPAETSRGITTSADRIRAAPIVGDMQVRRLTPRECERLQGFPDDYTLIQMRGKPAADGPRYKALGNSMAVPCMRWIGERIAAVEMLPVMKAVAL